MKFINHSLLALAVVSAASVANAHVDWTLLNRADPNSYAVFHLDESGSLADNSPLNVATGQFTGFNMLVDPTFVQAGTVTGSSDIFDTSMNPLDPEGPNLGSLIFSGTVTAVSPSASQIPAPNYQSNTVEFWFKWDVPFTTPQEVRVGARSAAKILIKRDPVTPTNDRFGLIFSHNDFVPAPGWVNGVTTWNDFAAEAPLGDWIHVAVAVNSTGLETTSPNAVTLAHELYDTGSKAWIYVGGHKWNGSFIDLGSNSDVVGDPGGTLPRGIRAHPNTRLTIDNITGAIKVDELAFWASDLTAGGTAVGTSATVFGDGKGSGVAAVKDWSLLD